ncbi:MAG: MOSC domain-containing protein [Gammaproteobacteria bacterium]|nr:MOSC domain-containing protein [Gammaproteobacteria bacterium]
MARARKTETAQVAGLLAATGADLVSAPVEAFQLRFGGLEGDRHAGLTRRSCSRTRWHVRGTEIANTRQISIVSAEECAEIAQLLDVPRIEPRLIGANIVIGGLSALSGLPPSTRLQFPSGATLFVTEENMPCRVAGGMLAQALGLPRLELDFPRLAVGRRGLVALVEREGEVRVGDTIELVLPRRRSAPPAVSAAGANTEA